MIFLIDEKLEDAIQCVSCLENVHERDEVNQFVSFCISLNHSYSVKIVCNAYVNN